MSNEKLIREKRTKTYSNGDIYEGEFYGPQGKGKKDGFGKYKFSDGREYVGEWKEGKRNGQGRILYKDGKVMYSGDFCNDVREGRGIYHFEDGRKYDGEWKNNKPDGFGRQLNSDGTVHFEGQFKEGKIVETGISKFFNKVSTGMTGLFKKKPEVKVVISQPKNFARLRHIGFVPGKGFEQQNIPAEWKETFLKCGFTEDDLKNAKIGETIANTIINFEQQLQQQEEEKKDDKKEEKKDEEKKDDKKDETPSTTTTSGGDDMLPPPDLDSFDSEMSKQKEEQKEKVKKEMKNEEEDGEKDKIPEEAKSEERSNLMSEIRERKVVLKSVKDRVLKPLNPKELDDKQKMNLMDILKKEVEKRKREMMGQDTTDTKDQSWDTN